MTASRQDLEEQIEMLDDAISEGSPLASKLNEIRTQKIEELERATGISYRDATEDVTVGRKAGSPTSNQYGTFTVYPASDKQVAFLRRLLDEKDLSGTGSVGGPIKVPTTLDGISKKSASALIDRLLNAPSKQGAAAPRLASDKQVSFIKKLLGEKDLTGTAFPVWDDQLLASLQMQDASPAIDMLMKLPRKPVAPEVVLAAGAYRLASGQIVRVYLGQLSGKMLCAELADITAEQRDDAWHYLGMASRFVSPTDHRLTVEECEELTQASGESHSWCCVCGRRLDDPNSVSRSIGPVCRAKQGA